MRMLVLAITTKTINVGVATGHDMNLHPDKDSSEQNLWPKSKIAFTSNEK